MRSWLPRISLVLAMLLMLAACSSGTSETTGGSTTTSAATASTEPSSSVTEPDGGAEETPTTSTSQAADPSPQVEGPVAPDFTFALADGSAFTLSEEQKPVYLVFWAEW